MHVLWLRVGVLWPLCPGRVWTALTSRLQAGTVSTLGAELAKNNATLRCVWTLWSGMGAFQNCSPVEALPTEITK
eukprot:659401-Amphidinium_carterae.2